MRIEHSQPVCACGCGEHPKPGNTFVHGHNNRSLFGEGEANVRWMGDEACASSVHYWINNQYPRTGVCEECGRRPEVAGPLGTHYAFLHHGQKDYTRDREDYRELCKPCHLAFDRHLLVAAGKRTANRRWPDRQAVTA